MACIEIAGIPDGDYCKDCRFKESDDSMGGKYDYCFAFEKHLTSHVRKLNECVISTVDPSKAPRFW